jgi:hypothetical protein
VPQVPLIPDDLILGPFFIVAIKEPAVRLSVLALARAMYPTNRKMPPDRVGALEYSDIAMGIVRQQIFTGDPPSDDVIVAQGFLRATSIIVMDKAVRNCLHIAGEGTCIHP